MPGLPLKGLPPCVYYHVCPQWYITSGNNVSVTVNEGIWNEEVMVTADVESTPGFHTMLQRFWTIPMLVRICDIFVKSMVAP